VLNLALCDFSMVLVLPILIYDSIDHKYPGHLQCQIFALCGSISGIGAGATNAAIAYDRYRYNNLINYSIIIHLIHLIMPR